MSRLTDWIPDRPEDILLSFLFFLLILLVCELGAVALLALLGDLP